MPPSAWHITVLGQAQLTGLGDIVLELDRKTAGLLAYLVIEGSAPRSRLAGYLWPESREETARNNLAQLLRKLRLSVGEELVPGSSNGLLRLADTLRADAQDAREAYLLGQYETFLAHDPLLLAGRDYDDCPEFEDWLVTERERWMDWRRAALRELSTQAERRGDLDEALRWAAQGLTADPVSEGAFVRVMTLQYLCGQRLEALQTFGRCQTMLKSEFGVQPLRQTSELARTIAQSTAVLRQADSCSPLPLTVLRPPRLIGRADQWRQLQQAHAAGQVLFLTGAPGSGKSRLALDFASSTGTTMHLQARPGDQDVPYATLTRYARQLTQATSRDRMPDWARQQLAGLLPELTTGTIGPQERRSEARLCLFRAFLELMRAAAPDFGAFVMDDLQFADQASQEVLLYVLANRPQGDFPALLAVAREGELAASARERLDALIETGLAVSCAVASLPDEAVQELLGSLEVPEVQHLAPDLARYTRGNPLFILETLKHVIETDGYLNASLGYFTLPRRVGVLIEQRLKRLPPTALQVAQAAAVLQRDFDLDVVSEVLNQPIFTLIPVWAELERAQIFDRDRFTHDIVYESVRSTLPGGVWQALHRSAARTLERHGAAPERIARHFLEGARPAEAVPFLRHAAQHAEQRYLLREAAQTYGQLADLLDQLQDQPAAFDALNAQAETLINLQDVDGVGAVVVRLQQSAVTLAQQVAARVRHCFLLFLQGDHTALLQASEEGLALAHEARDLRAEASFLEGIAYTDIIRGGGARAREAFTRMLEVGQTCADMELQAKSHEGLGMVIPNDLAQVLEHYRQAARLHEQNGNVSSFAAASGKRAWLHYQLGDVNGALHVFEHAYKRLVDVREGHGSVKLINAWGRSSCLQVLGRYAAALDASAEALATSSGRDAGSAGWRRVLELQRGRVLLEIGCSQEALAAIQPAIDAPEYIQNIRSRGLISLGQALTAVGQRSEAQQAFAQAEALLNAEKEPYYWAQLHLARAQLLSPEAQLAVFGGLLDLAQRKAHAHLSLAVQIRRAQALMALDLPVAEHDLKGDAAAHGVLSFGEVLLTRYQVACANASPDAATSLRSLTDWVIHTAQEHVPAGYCATFWASNPAARMVLEAQPALQHITVTRG
ncbi:AAA family ATPase [Deinococcus hopiensis]|uniref:AAA family ATPase n=1 Tax=Deinococcus hopiensis TaxID=309885 RepID=UPI001483285F|nr:AAA family ATPase [Deinococcus hopiensis]